MLIVNGAEIADAAENDSNLQSSAGAEDAASDTLLSDDARPRAPPAEDALPRAPPAGISENQNLSAEQPDAAAEYLVVDGGAIDPDIQVALTTAQLDPIFDQAVLVWSAYAPDQIALLESITISITNLADAALATATGSDIEIDTTAAGHGWFVDQTPSESSEFAGPGSAPAGVDLLTAVLHEIGHVLGYTDDGDYSAVGLVNLTSLMSGSLAGSQRTLLGPQDNGDTVDRVIDLTMGDDSDVMLTISAAQLTVSGSTFASITFDIPTGSVTINGLMGTDAITIDGIIDLGAADLVVNAEIITLAAGALITTTGNVAFTADAETSFTGSVNLADIDISAQIIVDGDLDVGGSVTLEATVTNTVDIDASGTAEVINSKSLAESRIGATATVTAGDLVVSAITNTNFALDITDATSGTSGFGGSATEAGRGETILLQQSEDAGTGAKASFLLWDAAAIDDTKETYVVTHGWQSELSSSFKNLLKAIRGFAADANIIFTDWSETASNLFYPGAADDTFGIGTLIANLLEGLGLSHTTTTLIGHSLGGQASGVAGHVYLQNTGNQLARIFALDPAGPVFEATAGIYDGKPDSQRLDAGDAARVVVLHSTTVLGFDARNGDLDLYLNSDLQEQPGSTNFSESHSYPISLLTELFTGATFSQLTVVPEAGDADLGDDLDLADMFGLLTGQVSNVTTFDNPIEINTYAGIEGGAIVVVGTAQISGTETASILIQAIDNIDLHSTISTATLADLSEDDYIENKIVLDRDSRAYIGGEGAQALLDNDGTATGLVKVGATNTGAVAGTVTSDFADYISTVFAQENVLAYIRNADVDAFGVEISAVSSTDYATAAEENSNTIRAVVEAYIDSSFVTAGVGGVAISARAASSFTATSIGLGQASSRNDVRNDVKAYAVASTINVTAGEISIAAVNQTSLTALTTLINGESNLTLAINVANGSTEAFASDSTLATINSGDVSLTSNNAATINATLTLVDDDSDDLIIAIENSAGMAFNAVGLDMANILLAGISDFLGDWAADFLEGIYPFAQGTPAYADAYISNSLVNAAGNLTVNAFMSPQINATVSNAVTAATPGLLFKGGMSLGGVLASNKILSGARAYIDETGGSQTLTTGGNVTVQAADNAKIYSNAKIVISSIVTNDGGAAFIQGEINERLAADYDVDGTEPLVDLQFGNRVWLSDDFPGAGTGMGNAGSVYEYLGTATTDTNLGGVDYTNLDFWKEVPETQLIPQGINLTDSDSIAIGGIVVLNDVQVTARPI